VQAEGRINEIRLTEICA